MYFFVLWCWSLVMGGDFEVVGGVSLWVVGFGFCWFWVSSVGLGGDL